MTDNDKIKISIIIVNFNTTEHIIKCLESTYDMTSGFDFEIIIVDNNSTDRSIEKINDKFPQVQLILRNINDGFGCGCNVGAKNSKGKYLAFVNPDTFIKDNVLLELFNFMEQNPDVGICSGSFYDYDGIIRASYSIYPNLYTEFLDAIGRGTNKRLMKYMENENIKKNIHFEVEWLMGAYMFFRKKCFGKINGFDKDFFLYLEDAEIQYRIKKAGYKIVYIPYIKIYHFNNSSVQSYDGENIYFYNTHRSKMIYFHKHFGFFKRNFVRTLLILGVLFRISILYIRSSFQGKKEQKMYQYKKILNIYFSNKRKLFESSGLL